jgi:hypothetical protein
LSGRSSDEPPVLPLPPRLAANVAYTDGDDCTSIMSCNASERWIGIRITS